MKYRVLWHIFTNWQQKYTKKNEKYIVFKIKYIFFFIETGG